MHHFITKQLATGKDEFTNLNQLTKQCQHIKHALKNANRNQANHERFTAHKELFNWTAFALEPPNAHATRLVALTFLVNQNTASTPRVILQPPQGQFTPVFALAIALTLLVSTPRAAALPLSQEKMDKLAKFS